MRCHQIRTRFPDVVAVACVLDEQSDLSSLRSRIPTEDAQHVVCSLQLLRDYLMPLLHPTASPAEPAAQSPEDAAASKDLNLPVHQMEQADLFDGPEEGMFHRVATNLARSLDAPIALVTVECGQQGFWEAQCGLPEDGSSTTSSEMDLSICRRIVFSDSILVIPDTEEDERFANDPFLRARGVRFYAGAPLKAKGGEVIGSLCVLDTRPREMTEQQKDTLIAAANAAMTAIELHDFVSAEEVASQEAS
jgi:GAF domain-containing protein